MTMLITIGKVVKPFGVKGEMKIESLTDFPERFQDLKSVYLVSPTGKELVVTVRSVRYTGAVPYMLFKGYDTPEDAKTLNGWLLKVPEQEVMPLPEGRYYWYELIGMEVVSEEGETLGTIVDIFETGSNDIYVMKQGKREIYIPAIRQVIKQVDRQAKRMVIRLMDGLMEL